MSKFLTFFAVGAGFCHEQAFAQALAGPGSAYFHDKPSRAILELRGYAGATTLGPAVVEDVDVAFVAPNGRTAVIRREEGYFWVHDLAQPANAVAISLQPFDQAAWSADSKIFAAYQTESGLVERVRLGESQEPLAFSAGLRRLVMNRDGSEMAAAAADNRLIRYAGSSGVREIPGISVRSLSFALTSNHTIFAIDEVAGAVVELSDNQTRVLATADQIGSQPLEVISLGGGDLSILTRDALILIRLDGSVIRRETLDSEFGQPRQISPLSFLSARSASGEPLYLLDFSREASLYFVPVTEK
jgi:hypothetical protein